ncbi:Macrophage erythroblast attacher [Armadillidium nasatum]|uniref:E3 ubiquitin-protein transferase MAEA n=1 Tax=Armadillidium nasatum TaxID=96803 RepID=A0A5N5SUY8_9CRUS|nr:Macrophage erythroblast attacher [Armadillidium nasatum]
MKFSENISVFNLVFFINLYLFAYNKIKASEISSIEHPTLKVPYEVLNKRFRLAQKSIDRELCHVTNAVSELEKVLISDTKDKNQITSLIGGVMEKLNSFKRKAEDVTQEEIECGRVIKRRVEHLKEHDSTSPAVICQWRKLRLDRLLMEYVLRAGYYNTASELIKGSPIKDLTNLDIFLVANDVEISLKNKDTSKCLAWCHDNKSKLRKHARKHFTGQDQAQMQAVQQCMALLAFPVNTDVSPYKELFSESRWDGLVTQFREENLNLFQISTPSAFSVALQAGLSALKTPHCYRGPLNHNPDCPVCQKNLNELASSLPYAHCSQSRLVCHISGEQLNEHNQPLMLPNGYVYGQKALEQMASENDGFVLCPRSHQTFTLVEAEKY